MKIYAHHASISHLDVHARLECRIAVTLFGVLQVIECAQHNQMDLNIGALSQERQKNVMKNSLSIQRSRFFFSAYISHINFKRRLRWRRLSYERRLH